MRKHLSIVRFEVTKAGDVEAQDIIDGVRTLRPASKLFIEVPYPGEGPDHFLRWAREELAEAEAATTPSVATRKAFNVSILSKCAVECLVDWYLAKYNLDLTISPNAGLVQKLEALNVEAQLGMGLSLFQHVIFEPRNNAIHRYELVDLAEAKRAYELANFAVLNCKNTNSPQFSPIFYGNLEIYRGQEAIQKGESRTVTLRDSDTAFYFAGIGDTSQCAVFIDRNGPDSKISILTSSGDGGVEARSCKIARKISSEQLREIIDLLESSQPRPIELSKQELDDVLKAMSGRTNPPGLRK